MKSLNTFIKEKLVINKDYKNPAIGFDKIIDKLNNKSYTDNTDVKLIRFVMHWHKDNGTYSNVNNTKDSDGWFRFADLNTISVKDLFVKKDSCEISYKVGTSGFDGTMNVADDYSFLYKYYKHGGNTYQLYIIINPEFVDVNTINKIIQLYNDNEETRYTDHFAQFKINSDDLKKMFGIDISKCKQSINSYYGGNYAFKLYETDEYKNLKDYLSDIE